MKLRGKFYAGKMLQSCMETCEKFIKKLKVFSTSDTPRQLKYYPETDFQHFYHLIYSPERQKKSHKKPITHIKAYQR